MIVLFAAQSAVYRAKARRYPSMRFDLLKKVLQCLGYCLDFFL